MSEEGEIAEIIESLEGQYAALKSEQAAFNANIKKKLSDIEVKLERAKAPFDDANFCRRCLVETGEKVRMTDRSAGQPGVDTFGCRNGHVRIVRR